MKKIIMLNLFVILSMSVNVCSWAETPEVSNRVVAFVNDELITLHELNKKIREMTGYSAAFLEEKDKRKFDDIQMKVLQHMIDQKLTQKKVKELGIDISPKEVDQAIEYMKRVNGMTDDDLMSYVKGLKIDYEKYRELIRTDLERMQLINFEVKSKIIVRDEDIEEYYKKHIEDYKVPGTVHLAGIFLVQKDPLDETEKKNILVRVKEIRKRLDNGEDFAALARELSMGPGADEGGDLGQFKVGQLVPELAGVVEKLSVGDISEPIIGNGNVHIIKLLDRKEGRTKVLEEVREAIYSVLYKEEVDNRYHSWLEELRNKSYTKIML